MSGRGDDDGLTLVELLVYMFIAALVLGSLALMFANGLRAQTQATDRDSATGAGNVVSSSLLASIRNASEFTVIDGRALVAKVATGGTGWECRAWVLGEGVLRYRTAHTALSTADTTEWGVIARGVTGTLPGGRAFAAAGDRSLTIGIQIVSGDTAIPFTNGVTAQAVDDGTDTTPCW
ncbi:MAG: prepilin-type N-terminal cleavage/methylation domain-containing protein [Microbacterium sp.]